MADIVRVDLTDVQDTLQGSYTWGFELTDENDNSILALAAGRTENILGSLYRVEDGDLAIGDPGVDNTYYVYVSEDGDGTATAFLSTSIPNYSPQNGGFYFGNWKAVYVFTRSGAANYINKQKLVGLHLDNVGDLKLKRNLDVSDTVTAPTLQATTLVTAPTLQATTIVKTNDLAERTASNGLWFSHNAPFIRTALVTNISDLAIRMEAQGFLDSVKYAASGYMVTVTGSTTTFHISGIQRLGITHVALAGYDSISGGYQSFSIAPGSTGQWALTIFRSVLNTAT